MTTEKKYGSIKRFGTRYGRSVKQRFAEVEAMQKTKYKCPSCGKATVKRLSVGIWTCTKCNAKFAGRAYTIEATPATGEE